MRVHTLAWAGWLTACSVYAFAVSNPYALATALSAVLLVHLSAPEDPAARVRPMRTFLVAAIVVLGFRLVFTALLPNPGQTTLFSLPRLALPSWAGGFGLGGRVTAEVVAESALEGLRLVLVLAAFGEFNSRIDFSAAVRAVPAVTREAGLVVAIALAFVPGVLAAAADVRDAQKMRGERGRTRLAPSLAVPILALSLERAFLLAESMDSRGYGRRRPRVTRMAPARFRTADVAIVSAAVGAVVAARVVAPGAWTAYPRITAPVFALTACLPALLFAAPVVADLARTRR
ncbi:MAG TPA: energy-coupling factor transporter transmembrane component T [Actinomycetota bacterium]|nr:energy-coupling factor transporter transmembrane component T [Actinomycetota bacterium]